MFCQLSFGNLFSCLIFFSVVVNVKYHIPRLHSSLDNLTYNILGDLLEFPNELIAV